MEKNINVAIITTIVAKMTTILRVGIENILQVFHNEKTSRLHIRELSRRTGLYGQSITRYLKELEKERILKAEKDGNQKKYSLQNNKKTYALLAILDIKKYEKLELIKKQAIKTYFEALPEKPVFSLLFGSTAKETHKESSDIDLLIITNNKINTKKAESEANSLTAQKISTFQITFKEFTKEIRMKEDKVVQSAIATGYPLTNQISYYEALSNEKI